MGNERLTEDMDTKDIIKTMSEGNPGAMRVTMEMLKTIEGFLNIILCDSLAIRGSRLYMLHNDCCGRNLDKFNRTLLMIKNGVYTEEEIQANLNLTTAIPFIDDSIEIIVPPYGEKFGPRNKNWKEYCKRNKEVFAAKLKEKLEQKNTTKRI